MNFKTIYDLTTERIHWFSAPLPLIYFFFFAAITIFIRARLTQAKAQQLKTQLISLAITLFASIFLFLFLGGQFMGRHKAKKIMASHDYFVVEGYPENFHPLAKQGHEMERFDIGEVHFEYSLSRQDAPGYHTAAVDEGIIRPGNYYRLTYYDAMENGNKIIKVEIRK